MLFVFVSVFLLAGYSYHTLLLQTGSYPGSGTASIKKIAGVFFPYYF